MVKQKSEVVMVMVAFVVFAVLVGRLVTAMELEEQGDGNIICLKAILRIPKHSC